MGVFACIMMFHFVVAGKVLQLIDDKSIKEAHVSVNK